MTETTSSDDTVVAFKTPPLRRVTVREYIDGAALKKDIQFKMTDLSDAMMQQASLFAHYGVLSAQAAKQVDDIKLLLEVTEAKIYRRLRDGFAKSGEKVTEAQLEKLVATTDQVIEIKKALNVAKQIEATSKTSLEAFRQRRDMLVQQGATSREEMKGELSINVRKAGEQVLENQKAGVLERMKQARGGAPE